MQAGERRRKERKKEHKKRKMKVKAELGVFLDNT
jgi:hypothetical protein